MGGVTRPAHLDRDRPTVALGRAFDGVSELRRGELALWKQFEYPAGSQLFRSQLLLGFLLGREWHDHCSSTGRKNVKDGIITGLAHRQATAPQHLREFPAIAFEDDVVRQGFRQPFERLLRQVRSSEQTPS